MANLVFEGNLRWYCDVFTKAELSVEIARKFAKTVEANITFNHNEEYAPRSSGFYYYKNEHKLSVFVELDGLQGIVIVSEKLGKMLGISPTKATYGEVYKSNTMKTVDLAKVADKAISLMNKDESLT